MKLKNKSVVITGASSGMGKAMVELFVKEGASVVAVARRKELLDEIAASLAGQPGKVIPYVGDVAVEKVIIGAIDLAVKEFGKLDVLVNNAGIMDNMAGVAEFDDKKLEDVFKLNTFGPFYAMRKAVNVFLTQGGGGSIVNVASEGAFHTCAGAVYCASKAAVVSLTRNTAYMYMPEKIRCNAIAPGGIKTEIGGKMGNLSPAGYERAKTVMGCAPPMGEAEDIAKATLFLASDDSSYISGDVLFVDGGWGAM